ncbi:MAG: thioredoxin family protein [Proteobacteria bacterium]|nr:thioredoxin family protein [Pseudomonadota bacterium]
MRTFFQYMLITLAVLGLAPQGASTTSAPVEVSLVSAVTATGAQGTLLLGVKFTVPRGWKIYAPSPSGEDPLGRAPTFAWRVSPLMPDPHVFWPKAATFEDPMETAHGYDRDVILPVTLDPQVPGEPINVHVEVTYLACAQTCVPLSKKLSLFLPAGPAKATGDAQEILDFQTGKRDVSTSIAASRYQLLLMMLFAFVGGLILNVMPCVLPVLSLKMRHFIKLKPDATHYRQSLMFSWTGIMVSFWTLAIVAIVLKRGGESVGWGLHFQSSSFLAFMSLLLVLFARGLWWEDSFALPPTLQGLVSKVLGAKREKHALFYEHFFSGVFATLLATPCTAPFLGTALGYALSQGALEIMLLFSVMGFGFALPYLLLLKIPPQKVPLPKSGPWMVTLSRILAVVLLMTALWLMWVFSHQEGALKACLVALGLLVGILFLYRKASALAHAGKGLIVVTLLASIFWQGHGEGYATSDAFWTPFEEAKIAGAVAAGQVVFVDVTASWCATCQVNKLAVMGMDEITQAFKEAGVLALRADWTQRNPAITKYLAHFGRAGIPFNVVYGPKAPQGIVLPEILTKDAVLGALKKAKGD